MKYHSVYSIISVGRTETGVSLSVIGSRRDVMINGRTLSRS